MANRSYREKHFVRETMQTIGAQGLVISTFAVVLGNVAIVKDCVFVGKAAGTLATAQRIVVTYYQGIIGFNEDGTTSIDFEAVPTTSYKGSGVSLTPALGVVAASATTDQIAFAVTGIAGVTIDWTVEYYLFWAAGDDFPE